MKNRNLSETKNEITVSRHGDIIDVFLHVNVIVDCLQTSFVGKSWQ